MLHLGFLVGVLFLYFHRIVGLDAPTAYFSATPGGLSEMVITGAAMGADDRTIALVHLSRVLLVVLTIPLWYRYMTGVVTTPSSIGPSISAIGLIDITVLAACAIAGVFAGRLIRLPAYRLSGPLLASAAVHASGLNESAPPWEVVAVAQVVVGSAIGARFSSVSVRRVLGLMAAAVVSTAVMLAATVAFALVLAPATGIDWRSIVLAYAPGGLAEMSLIALSLGIENRVRRDPSRHPDRACRGRGAARVRPLRLPRRSRLSRGVAGGPRSFMQRNRAGCARLW